MQRRAFEVTADWDDVEESELDPPALDRLEDIRVPTLALLGGLDLDAIHDAARRIAGGIPDARRVDWPDTAHLPSMERPVDFLALLQDWLAPSEATPHHCGFTLSRTHLECQGVDQPSPRPICAACAAARASA